MTNDELEQYIYSRTRQFVGAHVLEVINELLTESEKKRAQVIPQGVMGIPPNPAGTASMQVRSDIVSMNAALSASIADTAAEQEIRAYIITHRETGSKALRWVHDVKGFDPSLHQIVPLVRASLSAEVADAAGASSSERFVQWFREEVRQCRINESDRFGAWQGWQAASAKESGND